MNSFNELIKSSGKEMIKSLQECIRIESISGHQEETRRALDYYLGLGQNMGFKTKNINNLGGIIEFGEGAKTIGIIVHLDVVPEGSGWKFPPFEGQIENGRIYGRGAIDDKGPAISVLYALNAVKDSGAAPSCKIQIITGIDEETVWNTTPELLKIIKEPYFSFVPDSRFPLVIAEKGLIWLELKRDFPVSSIKQNKESGIIIQSIAGGDFLNIVPDHCEAVLISDDPATVKEKLNDYIKETHYKIDLEENNAGIKLISHGKPAHAFVCNEGQNAVSQLLIFLSSLDINEEQKKCLTVFVTRLGMEHFGESLGLACEDQLTGKLTVNPGFISMDKNSFTLRFDIRFPANQHLDSMKEKVRSAFQCFEAEQTITDSLESLSFPEDDPHIQRLLQVYREYTGDAEAKPLGMGGTTFAKAFKNAVSFGPAFPGMAKVEHQPDEYMEIDHLLRCTEIYALAISELMKDDVTSHKY